MEKGTDHSYFQDLERAFIRLRGAPLLLSPADWQMAKEWHEQGIPVDLVERVIGEVLEARRSREGGAHIVTLRYFRKPVENAWKSLAALRATGLRGEADDFDAQKRLQGLADALPRSWRGSEELKTTILGLEGDPELIEKALVSLEDDLLERLEQELGEVRSEEMDRAISTTLAGLGTAVEASEIEMTRKRLKREAIRRHYELPELSLFAIGGGVE